MNMKPWYHVMRDARLVEDNKEMFAYLWGSNGEHIGNYVHAKDMVEKCYNMNPQHFEDYVIKAGHTMEELAYHIVGKQVFDCSSFACAVTQSKNKWNDLVVIADFNSYGLKDNFVKETSPGDGVWASILWKKGHVGVDVANGFAIDFACEFVDVRQYRHVDYNSVTKFIVAGQLPWVDYTGALNV